MPTILQKYAIKWYHKYLLHPGVDCTDDTIGKHYYWDIIRDDMRTQIRVCNFFIETRNKA